MHEIWRTAVYWVMIKRYVLPCYACLLHLQGIFKVPRYWTQFCEMLNAYFLNTHLEVTPVQLSFQRCFDTHLHYLRSCIWVLKELALLAEIQYCQLLQVTLFQALLYKEVLFAKIWPGSGYENKKLAQHRPRCSSLTSKSCHRVTWS